MKLDRWREPLKMRVRGALGRRGFGISGDPFEARVVRAIRAMGITTVVDVGANEGQYAHLLRACGFEGRLVSFEPLVEAYARLERRSERDREWVAVRCGLSAEPGELDLNVAANSFSSSLLPMTEAHLRAAPSSAYQGTQRVEVRTLAAECARLEIDVERCLVKVDTQGSETAVLAGAGPLLGRFAALQIEISAVELYAGQATESELLALVAAHGFVRWAIEPGIADASGRLLQYDALFVRDALAEAGRSVV